MPRNVRQMIGVPQNGADWSATAWESRKNKLFYGFTVAEIQKYFSSFFGSNEDIQKSFWNYLTFSKSKKPN